MSGNGAPVDVVVLGSGPGGYTAAFRAADLGLSTVLVERYDRLGGVCLNVGCIPSKALLHAAAVITGAEEARARGIGFGAPEIDLPRLRDSTAEVVTTLTKGLDGLAKRRKVRVVHGTARFTSPHDLEVETAEGPETITFAHAIIAAGSQAATVPGLPDDPRIMDSTGALQLEEVPERLLVIGGGIIGLEMATVYDALGSRITVVEMLDRLIPGCDPDLVTPLRKRIEARYEAIHLSTRVAGITPRKDGLHVAFEGERAPSEQVVDRVLVAVGRRANGDRIGAEAAGVEVGERGIIHVDERMRTNVEHILAIGDVTGEPMLAHKATHQGTLAAEIIAGENVVWDRRTIPAVAYTDPEIAWMGLTEGDAKERGIEVEVAAIPWAVSGRALGIGRPEGRTKLITEPGTERILGAGIVGPNAGELIAETVLALELGASAGDIALTVHPHPTLSETVALSAEWAEGTITDLLRRSPGRVRAG